MKKIVFATNDKKEFNVIKEKFDKYGIDIEQYNYNCDDSINNIPKHKAMKVYNLIGKECFVISSRLYVSNNKEELVFSPKNKGKYFFINRLTYYDGTFFRDFYRLSDEIYGSNEMITDDRIIELWENSISLDSRQVLINMTEEEKSIVNNGIDQITTEFLKWKTDYITDLNSKMASFNEVKRLLKK